MVKRSRIGTASNLGKTGVINYVTSPWQQVPTNGFHPSVVQQSSGFERAPLGIVLSLSSPENREVDRVRIGFLEQCYYCKSRIFTDKEVFMYSENAFCKPLCREMQMFQEDRGEEVQTAKRKVVD